MTQPYIRLVVLPTGSGSFLGSPHSWKTLIEGCWGGTLIRSQIQLNRWGGTVALLQGSIRGQNSSPYVSSTVQSPCRQTSFQPFVFRTSSLRAGSISHDHRWRLNCRKTAADVCISHPTLLQLIDLVQRLTSDPEGPVCFCQETQRS